MDISSLYDTYSSKLHSVSPTSVSSQLSNVSDASSDEELLEACKSFETYFVQKMIESMKATTENEEEDGEYMKVFSDTLNQSYAEAITDSGQLGLAQQLYESMKRQYKL